MELIIKVLVLSSLLLFFASCIRKKAEINNLQDWLEKHFPGRFQVLSTESDEAIRKMSFQVKKSVVAETASPLVQVQLKWDKRQPDFNLSPELVEAYFSKAQIAQTDAAALNQILKTHGFVNYSVGLKTGTATVLLFENSQPETRQEYLAQLEKVFANWPQLENYDKEILLMESGSESAIQDEILPLSYFLQNNGQYRNQVEFSVYSAYDQVFTEKEYSGKWQFNTQSQRFSAAYSQAYAAMEIWAKEHVRKPYSMLEFSEYEEISQEPLAYRFKFAFTYENPDAAAALDVLAEPNGYFIVDFDIDRQTVLKINISQK
ncbi:MAG: hypothetical protein KDC34_19335 [Saprospiraceae bacterium]|nr:hypothetical protein [Saprospiraceae bacterium]